MSFFKVDQGKKFKVSKEFKKELLTLVKEIEGKENNKYARHSVLTTAVWFLKEAQSPNEALALAKREIKTSPHPYYYMRYLSQIELDRGHTKQALSWSKKAWDKSRGHATRFEWGTSYLLKLLKHDESNIKEITTAFNGLITEFKKEQSMFYGRSKRRYTKLKSSLKEWNKKHPKHVLTL